MLQIGGYHLRSPSFYGKEPQPLLWATPENITVNGLPNCLNYCKILTEHTQFTNVAVHSIIQPGGPRFGDP